MRKIFSKDWFKLKKLTLEHKIKLLMLLFYNVLFLILPLAIVGVKVLYPFHVFVGVGIYILSYLYFFYKIYKNKKTIAEFETLGFLYKKYLKIRYYVLVGIVILLVLISIFTVLPIFKNPIRGLSEDQISRLVNDDVILASIMIDDLESNGQDLIKSLSKTSDNINNREDVKKKWDKFIGSVYESEILTERHRYFVSIKNNDLRYKSFLVSYSLYLKKYEIVHRIANKVVEDEVYRKILNDQNSNMGISNLYTEMTSRFYHPKTTLRINLGWAYYNGIDYSAYDKDHNMFILNKKTTDSYTYLKSNVDKTALNSFAILGNFVEFQMFETWFPIQKNVANAMGNIYISSRHDKLIEPSQILDMKEKMEPGDIMVQRRNWYLSNVGIPGFWAHAALYTGSLFRINEYFSDIFPIDGFDNATSYIEEKYPEIYLEMSKLDSEGFNVSVIEAQAPGVILQSLEVSAHADYVGVMRPNLNKEDKFKAIIRSFDNFGKPYDYDFDFDTKDALVCSELVYDAYLDLKEKKGLAFELGDLNGRSILAPTDIVVKFYEEHDENKRDLDFVYFIDGNEKLGKAFVKGEQEFMTTWTRPKFDWFQD